MTNNAVQPQLIMRRQVIETNEENKLLTNLITSTGFCKEILSIVSPKIFKIDNSRIIFTWIKLHYKQYKKAPGKKIKEIYEGQTEKIQESTISDYLQNLSKTFEELEDDYDVLYEIDKAKKYIKIQNLEHTINEMKLAIKKNEIEKAENILTKHSKNLEYSGTLFSNINDSMINGRDLVQEDIQQPAEIISPWLTDGNISMLYAPRGIGKTWLSLALAIAITRQNSVGLKIGPWEVMNPSGVLYIDGEMGEYEIQKRVRGLEITMGQMSDTHPLVLLTASRYAKKHGKLINISTEEYRNALYQYLLENEQFQLLILDNIASLTPGIPENSKEDWDPINQWLISLRHLNISVLLVHHAGKGNKQRGTSGREDTLDCIIKMAHPVDYSPSDGAKFKLYFEKARNVPPGPGLKSFIIQITEDDYSGGIYCDTVTEDYEN